VGVKQCTEKRDMANTLLKNGMVKEDFSEIPLSRELSNINPVSQNKSRPLKYPVNPNDMGAFLSPNFDKNQCAMTFAPPVCSRMAAIKEPEIRRNPRLPTVFPNPSFIKGNTSERGIVAMANINEMAKRTINA
jgi:hypothetical protein